jgi:hypothetical protein
MPQIRNTTTEEYGADDEVKKFVNEYEDENAANETNVDLVNDIKSDLIKKDAERHDSEVGECSKLHYEVLICLCFATKVVRIFARMHRPNVCFGKSPTSKGNSDPGEWLR